MAETLVPGTYQVVLNLPKQGTWDLNILFIKDGQKHKLNQRIIVKGEGAQAPKTLERIVNLITPQ